MTKAPRYVYVCAKCGGPVTKPPLITIKDKEDAKGTRLGLGGWRCRVDGSVKVKRRLNRPQEE